MTHVAPRLRHDNRYCSTETFARSIPHGKAHLSLNAEQMRWSSVCTGTRCFRRAAIDGSQGAWAKSSSASRRQRFSQNVLADEESGVCGEQ